MSTTMRLLVFSLLFLAFMETAVGASFIPKLPATHPQRKRRIAATYSQSKTTTWALHTSSNQINSFTTPSSSSSILEGQGMPYRGGWRKSGRLSRITKWADSKTPNRPIICEYDPKGLWLWFKWKGTVLKSTWGSVLLTMVCGLALHFVARYRCSSSVAWPWFSTPNPTDPLIMGLTGLKKAWEFHLTICTFILTFFTSQSFGYWQKIYSTSRIIQGRINDYCMLLIMGAQRQQQEPELPDDKIKITATKAEEDNGKSSVYSDSARELVKTCTRLIRMSHIFFWAATQTSSNGLTDCERFIADAANCPLPEDEVGPLLLSPSGLKALVNTGQLTNKEASSLTSTGLPPPQYAFVLLTWVGRYTMEGLQNAVLQGGAGYEGNLFSQLTQLRASMFDIDDLRAGRMPLAYVQLVQVLVDSLVVLSPFALYPEIGILSVPLVGLLALFFRGLLVLSKSFLDPFGVEGFEEQCINIDVLVSELNFGATKRWIQAGNSLPAATSV